MSDLNKWLTLIPSQQILSLEEGEPLAGDWGGQPGRWWWQPGQWGCTSKNVKFLLTQFEQLIWYTNVPRIVGSKESMKIISIGGTCRGKDWQHQRTLPVLEFCLLVLQHPHTRWPRWKDWGETWALRNSSVNGFWINFPSQSMSLQTGCSVPEQTFTKPCYKVYNVHATVQAFHNFPSQESRFNTFALLHMYFIWKFQEWRETKCKMI